MTAQTQKLIYSIEGLEAEALYLNYLTFLEEQRAIKNFTPCDSPVVNSVANQYLKDFKFKDPGKPSEAITVNKFKLLVHLLILGNYDKDNHRLNATILQKLIGPHYNLMLQSMCFNGIISKSDYYIPGKSSFTYTIFEPYQVKIRTNKNFYVQKRLEKLKTLYKKLNDKEVEKISDEVFRKQYESNLNKLGLVKYDIRNFIYQLPCSEKAKVTYFEVLDKLENRVFNLSEDERRRIYSTFTRTPKIMRNFLPLRFSTDVSNSQPLLLNYFLIQKYNIELHILNDIYSTSFNYNNNDTTIIHNAGKNLYNELENNSKAFIRKSHIPRDVLLYIYLSSNGKLWNFFQLSGGLQNVPRYLLKEKLFEQVFYNKKLSSWKREFAKAFKTIFPNVYSAILDFRREVNKNGEENLALKMTRLESEIIRNILQRTWDAGMETLNIHDALILLDTEKNKNFAENQVNKIIKSVYKEYGLFVTTTTDYFSIEQAEDELQVLQDNQQKIDELKSELYQTALTATDDELFQRTVNLMDGLEDGSIEVVFEGGNPFLIFNN
uniref:hypothetical protein n=1 Tax=uncultured Draconibacterium sp. TaxID=1573823 RepID=UPI003217C66C